MKIYKGQTKNGYSLHYHEAAEETDALRCIASGIWRGAAIRMDAKNWRAASFWFWARGSKRRAAQFNQIAHAQPSLAAVPTW